ncbi:PSP1 C-terminal domain-containing protein [Anatilimnocola sp. NA78]|uniref:PSP1 C-terminal domain-containing protein n=1 Tax=Anatilimnocola sp. NA78 TaxID=3415683 RepID=UPI003CE4F86E
MGQVSRFGASDGARYARGARVVCRTERGLEVGEVLSPVANETDNYRGSTQGSILRRVGVEDDLLLARLDKNRQQAFLDCEKLLADHNIPAALAEVELLFDGQHLFFYFLGDTTPEVDALTAELAQTYAATVQFHQFADLLTQGCGPGCGTPEAEGGACGTGPGGGCAGCAVAAACSPRVHHSH